jgi:glycosyltransferase involved in cell wall biosynthesis
VDIVYGSALWFTPVRVNCHHLTERLGERRDVLFVESVGARAPRVHDWRRMLPRLLRSVRPLRRLGPRLWVYSPLPLPLWRHGGAATNSRWVGWQVRVLLKVRRWSARICWVFHPMGLGTAELVDAQGTVYYCVDDYAANPGVDPHTVRALEAALAAQADLTVTTGEPLARRLREHARRVEVLPNVVDTELFGRDTLAVRHPVLDALDALPSPRLGYIGNLAAYKLDLELVAGIARLRPTWSIVLIGPMNLGDVQRAVGDRGLPSNVHYLGPVSHGIVPAAIDRFEVALLPSARHEVMQSSFPLKFFEYLSRGRPVVARPIPMLEPYQSWFAAATTAEEFVAAAEQSLPPDAVAAERRQEFAAGFGWRERMARLEALRSELLGHVGAKSANR